MQRPTWILLGLLAITLAGATLRAWRIDQPLWFDEASDTLTSAPSAGIAYRQFITWTHDFQAAPLTFLLRRLAMDLLGSEAPWVQRLPALLCAVACIPLMFWLGRSVHGPGVGLLGAALLAFDPATVDVGQQSRSYPTLLLLALGAMLWAIKLLRDPRRSPLHWAGLGVVLGLAFCTTQFALALWAGLVLALFPPKTCGVRGVDRAAALGGMASALLVAAALGHVGLWNLFAKDSARGWGAAMTYPAIGREILVAAKDLLRLPPPALVGPLLAGAGLDPQVAERIAGLGLLVYPAAALGLWRLYRRCPQGAAVPACVAVCMVLLLFPFRRTHHFMAPRYLTLGLPALWLGVAVLAVEPAGRRWRRAASAAAVALFLATALWHSVFLEAWFTGADRGKWLVAPQIAKLRAALAGADRHAQAVVYQPQILEKVGRLLELPIDPHLEAGFYENYRDRPDPRVPGDFDAPVTWLVVAMIADDSRLQRARRVVDAIAAHYRQAVDAAQRDRHVAPHRTAIGRFSGEGIAWQSIGPGEPDRIAIDAAGAR